MSLYCVYCRGYYDAPHRCRGEGAGSARHSVYAGLQPGFETQERARRRGERRAVELLQLIRESLDAQGFTLDDIRAEEDSRNAARQGGRAPRRYGPSHLARLVDAGLVEDLGGGVYAVAHAPDAELLEELEEL